MSKIRQDIEEEVRRAWEAGDVDAATTAAIRGYGPEVMGFIGGRMQNAGAADDVFAYFCEDLWKGLPKFQWRSSLRVFCYTLARNAANRYGARVLAPGQRNVGLSGHLSELVNNVRTSTAAYRRTEVKTRAQQLRAKLEPEDRAILILRIDKELSWPELAAVMSETEDAATLEREAARLRKRFQLAKDRLRKLAEREGLVGPSSS